MSAVTFLTMVVLADAALPARAIAAALSPAGQGMFIVGLVPASGPADAEPVQFVSTGPVDSQFADLLALNDGQALYDAAAAGAAAQGLPVTWTVDDCVVLLATSDVSAERPWPSAEGPGVFARLGVQLHQQSEALA
jgi:hypothetical protein